MGKMSSSSSSGSHAHVGERRGPGEVAGAGQLNTPHNGPGRTVGRAGMKMTENPNRPTGSSSDKGMKTTKGGEE